MIYKEEFLDAINPFGEIKLKNDFKKFDKNIDKKLADFISNVLFENGILKKEYTYEIYMDDSIYFRDKEYNEVSLEESDFAGFNVNCFEFEKLDQQQINQLKRKKYIMYWDICDTNEEDIIEEYHNIVDLFNELVITYPNNVKDKELPEIKIENGIVENEEEIYRFLLNTFVGIECDFGDNIGYLSLTRNDLKVDSYENPKIKKSSNKIKKNKEKRKDICKLKF